MKGCRDEIMDEDDEVNSLHNDHDFLCVPVVYKGCAVIHEQGP